MPDTEFEPFGEPIPSSLRASYAAAECQGSGSRLILRTGVSLFWTLVIAVLVARVTYFDPDIAHGLSGTAVALAKAVCALLA